MMFRPLGILRAVSSMVALLGLVSGCGMIKNMEDMHDSTQDMSVTTRRMSATTEEMLGQTQVMTRVTQAMAADTSAMTGNMREMLTQTRELGDMTGELVTATQDLRTMTRTMVGSTDELRRTGAATYQDLRQGNAVTLRTERLREMERAEVMEAKIGEAGKYFMAFEFQLWKDFAGDDAERRVALYQDAMAEFFRDFRRYIDSDRDIDPSSSSNSMRNAFALAVAVHRINPNQERLSGEHQFESASVLTLVKEALLRKPHIEAGHVRLEDVPAYQREVLLNEQDAVYLLQLRATFLATMVLGRISDITDVSDVTKFGRAYLWTWENKTRELNLEQLTTFARWMREANHTRHFLQHVLHRDPRLHGNLRRIYNHMRWSAAEPTVAWATQLPVDDPRREGLLLRARAIQELKDVIYNYWHNRHF